MGEATLPTLPFAVPQANQRAWLVITSCQQGHAAQCLGQKRHWPSAVPLPLTQILGTPVADSPELIMASLSLQPAF
jgi:hypothetical protein